MGWMKNLAIKAAKETGKLLLENFRTSMGRKIIEERQHDLKIRMDTIAEDNIVRMIKDSGMPCMILSEETGLINLGGDEYKWVVDPLDGTVNYVNGVAHFCVSIALEKKGKVILGVVYDPVKDELFLAEDGKSAWLNGKKIRVSRESELGDAIVVTDTGRSEKTIRMFLKVYKKLVFSVNKTRIMGSGALDLCYTAVGRFDANVYLESNPWDVAAGGLIVKEAGGKITRLNGEAWNHYFPDMVCTNNLLHEKMLNIIRG